MDKTEYRMKLDEINSLVDAQDYEGALQIADTIDWRRVKSIRTLCMVADIYEVNGKLESSMKMLQLAYKRSSVGKMILYRLVELCLKMGRSEDAVSYYNEYLETASNDTSKYILKYKILKAQNAPLEDQIQVLEEYREREYTERWVYELAKLYKSAGKEHKCVETCDDLILWFGEGKYVTKAMELKMAYTPLTVSQREKYEKASAATGSRPSFSISQPDVTEAQQITQQIESTVPLAMHTAAAAAEEVSEEKKEAAAPLNKEAETPVNKSADMETDAHSSDAAEVNVQIPPQVDAGKIRENSVQLQERLAKSFQEVLSGINRSRAVASMENLGKAAGTEPLQMPEEENISDYQVKDLKPESAVENKVSGDKGEAIAHRTQRPEPIVKENTEKPEDKEITSVKDVDLEALFAETSSMIAETIGEVQTEKHEEEALETPEDVNEVETEEFSQESSVLEETSEDQETDVPEETEESEESTEQEEASETEKADIPEDDLTVAEDSEAEEVPVQDEMTEQEETSAEEVTDDQEISENPEDFSDIEAALAREAQGFMEETETKEDHPVEADEKESAEEQEAELDAERAMEAFAASLGDLTDAESESTGNAEMEEDPDASDIEETPVTEEEPSEESTETKADEEEAAMAAFEATLNLEMEGSFEEEVSEEDPKDEIEEISEEVIEEVPEETEEEDPFLSSVSGNTEELDIEAQLRAVLGEQENERIGEIAEDELARTLFGSEDPQEMTEERDSEEEGLAQEEILEEVPVEEESFQEVEVQTELSQEEDVQEDTDSHDTENASENTEMDFTPDIDLDIVLEANKEKEEEQEQLNIDMLLEEAEAEPEMPSTIPEGETPEEKRIRIMNATRPDRLTDQQKKLFSYFAKIPGMDQQILDAINRAYSHSGERTSRRGNIAIMGSHGTGKSRLSDGLVKALCKELGLPAVKYARLDASDMNSKDPARVVAKLSGGFLLIERAGHMSADTINKLSKSMDFRTDSLIVIIEDDKTSMRRLLAEYPEFAEKFATVISIPVFTNDELVTFARTYARENGYRMDEMGVLALYTLIGNNQREDEPITVGKVKEMVDGAIRRAGGGLKLGRKISKRHTDEEGRIYLYEKDFDL